MDETGRQGQITTLLYVNCGDESVRTYADGTRLTFSYNGLGQLVGVADSTGLRTFSYDAVGRLQSVLGPEHPGGQPITYGYDSNSNRTLLQSWQGLQTYLYDPRDLLIGVQDFGYAMNLFLSTTISSVRPSPSTAGKPCGSPEHGSQARNLDAYYRTSAVRRLLCQDALASSLACPSPSACRRSCATRALL